MEMFVAIYCICYGAGLLGLLLYLSGSIVNSWLNHVVGQILQT